MRIRTLVCEKKNRVLSTFFLEIVDALGYFEEQIHELMLEQNPYEVQLSKTIRAS